MGIVEIGLPKLSEEQILSLMEVGEEAAKEHIFSKVPPKKVRDMDVSITMETGDLLTITVDVGINLAPTVKMDPEALAREAAEKAFEAIEEKMRELALAGQGA